MFILSLKLNKKKLLLGIGIVLCAVAVVFAAGKLISGVQQTVAETKIKTQKTAGETESQRQSFLTSFGWQTSGEPAKIAEIRIPEEFDTVYEEYNNLQKTQGMDLSKYKGKRCKKYEYAILNYPDQPEHVSCTLLVVDGKIVGGDVCCTEGEGFTHGFALPS